MSGLDREKLLTALRARQDRESPRRNTGLVIIAVMGGLIARIQAGEFDKSPAPVVEVRPRQSGKLYEASVELAAQTGLSRETVVNLLQAGWTYSSSIDRPPRWEHPGPKISNAGTTDGSPRG